jgi:transcriptional regulator with XRE-family HTH domain
MSETSPSKQPFRDLGAKLRSMRTGAQKSLAEVSGAVEIDSDILEQYETGQARPSEDILLLLISHFDLHDSEATSLWELAGYTKPMDSDDKTDDNKQVVMVMPMDARVVYTDTVQVSVNNFGVIMNFMQGFGTSNQPLAVSRVGMSKEHARSVITLLEEALMQAEQTPKALPMPKSNKKPRKSEE